MGDIINANISLETRMPLCKKCKQFLSIEFHDYINISLDCQCQDINRMSLKEFENEFLCEAKPKKEDEIIKIYDSIPSEIEELSESFSKPKHELNEKTINSQANSNDKKENNESLLKQNLKGFNPILNNDLKEVEEISDTMSSETNNEIEFEQKKSHEIIIDIQEEDLCKCIKHKKEFVQYCDDCRFDLCIDCLNMESDVYSNTSIINKKHENHTKILLEKIKEQFEELDKLIEVTMNNEKVFKANASNLTIILKIIKCFMNNYEKYKCYNLYKSIENAKKFLEKINNNELNMQYFQEDYNNKLKIASEEELSSQIFFSSKMYSIDIQYKEKMDMSIFYNRDFGKLEELILVGNKIKDISSLSPNGFPQLKILNLCS